MSMEPVSLEFAGGKYRVEIDRHGCIIIYRHGKEWKDATGDKFLWCVLNEYKNLREKCEAEIGELCTLLRDKEREIDRIKAQLPSEFLSEDERHG